MFRIPSLRSRINELESDNECLRRIQYELLTTNSILTGNISDLKAEVEHFREEAELNDDRVLQTQIECDTLLELNEALRAENTNLLEDNTNLLDYNARLLDDNTSLIGDNTNLLDENARLLRDNTGLLDDNARLYNALREAKEKLAQQANTVVQPAPVEEPEDVRPKWVPSMDEAVKMSAASIKGLSEEEILVRLTKRDDVIRNNLSMMDIQRGRAEQALTEVAQTFKRIQKIIDGDLNA